jgi:stearoyl-CoA desaturase (delta-9 desaturase)
LHLVPPVLLAVALYVLGGASLLVWGFFISTTLLWHGTFTINSLSHIFGKRRYKTTDTSRNNWLLALLTLGEGWHNNHHYHQNTANQGWFWWEVDLSYYSLKALSWVGVVEGLRKPPEAVKYAYLKYSAEERAALAAPAHFWGARAQAKAAAARAAEVASDTVREVREAAEAAGDRVREAAEAAGGRVREAAEAAGGKVRDALAAAADHLPTPPEPQLKQP